MPTIRSFMVLPALPKPLKELDTIARNLFWSWNHNFIELFKRIDSNLWESCNHNPVKVLSCVSQERLEELASDKGFLRQLNQCCEILEQYKKEPAWFEKLCPKDSAPTIAYFSAEFGIHECLPIYAGGLGCLAGDHLKSASDLGVPIVGVGLMYQKGYFRQYLNVDGWQQEMYRENEFHNMPLQLVHQENGHPLTISVDFPGRSVSAQIWAATVGRVKLFLLDTNIMANSPADRMTTATLYGGDIELRIRQELLLGIGGFRALLKMGITPTVCHMNEGHAGFMALERIRQLQNSNDMSFAQAAEAARAGNIFTVHTPVKAGIDEFRVDLMDKYFCNYYPSLNIDRKQFLSLGRILPDDDNEPFKMPILALKLSGYFNGVSKLHGEVSRGMWGSLWPSIPLDEVPITSITNGVHAKSWVSEEIDSLFESYLGPNWANESTDSPIWANVKKIPDEEYWQAHQRCKGHLISFARQRLKEQMQRRGTYHSELNQADEVLDLEALTIGFARRFATYKRGNLLLEDPKRFVKLLTDTNRPIQLIFAGKAHPRDTQGKEIIRQIINFACQHKLQRRLVFLEDYDINVARFMLQGVDIWLNSPRKPMEASGTSGMKASVNGALNLSTLDGWWCEGFRQDGGWVIGSDQLFDDPAYGDRVESQSLYNILENEIIPLFYTRSVDNVPKAWVSRVKNSMQWIIPQFNTHRMVTEYTEKFYKPAIEKWNSVNANNYEKARQLSEWKEKIKSAWNELAIKDVHIEIENTPDEDQVTRKQPQLKVGSKLKVQALVKLGRISPEDVSVQLYHGSLDAWGNIKNGSAVQMTHQQPSETDNEHWFSGTVSCAKAGQHGVAVRVLPKNDDLINPYELGVVLWESPAEMSWCSAR